MENNPAHVLKDYENGHWAFYCPGCHRRHVYNVSGSNGRPCWTWNNDLIKPTFNPSYLEHSGHYVTGQPQPPNCYLCNREKEEGIKNYVCGRCHLYVRDGMIEFLTDCTHALAGKTVPMVPIGEWK